MPIRGLDVDRARDAVTSGTPLPGSRGFGGTVDDLLVTDVLGRVPVFLDAGADAVDPRSPGTGWGFDPESLSDPVVLPPGHRLDLAEWCPDDDPHQATRWARLPDRDRIEDVSTAVERLRTAIENALGTVPDVPVGFSGGVDSAVLAACSDGPLYVAGVPGSHDRTAAARAAEWLDRPLRTVDLDRSAIRNRTPAVARAIGRTNPMDVSIALPIRAVAERAAADGYDRLLLGQGADELFGGYDKFANAPTDPRLDAETLPAAQRELVRSLPGQLERDVRALRSVDVDPVVPYLDDRVIEAALALPGPALVGDDGTRKRALRQIARSFVPDELSFAEKTAVQYGSDVADELDRLARDAGFKPRTDDHGQQYIRDLVGSPADPRSEDSSHR